MRLKVIQRETTPLKRFHAREWRNSDLEHYGAVQRWSKHEFRIIAREQKKVVGSLELTIKRGVCEINGLVVAKTERGTGIGTALMDRAEQLARRGGVHKIWLITGKGWDAEPFYRKLGFRKNTILPNHYFGKDFVLYEKMLN